MSPYIAFDIKPFFIFTHALQDLISPLTILDPTQYNIQFFIRPGSILLHCSHLVGRNTNHQSKIPPLFPLAEKRHRVHPFL